MIILKTRSKKKEKNKNNFNNSLIIPETRKISNELKALLFKLLEKDPNKRISIEYNNLFI